MMPSYRIVFYISGHGFGHASRSLEVIRALMARRSGVAVTVRTSVPRRRFDAGLDVIEFPADTGMLQTDSLQVDVAGSLRAAAAFHARLPEKAEAEGRFLREAGVDLVVGDIPALAFAAAAVAERPSIAIGNFTWDWIYAGYADAPAELLRATRDAYAQASLGLRLPMSAGFETLASRTRDIPFVARQSQREPRDVRLTLGIPDDKPMVLTSFGAYGLKGLDMGALERQRDYTVITDDFPLRGFQYPDLVRAADVVITKPGYGIISECIANDTAMLYTSRGQFPEYDLFVREMPKYLRAQFIEQHDLLAVRWTKAIEQLLALPKPTIAPAINGAEVAADAILACLPNP
jgi:UDP:flavonoid glycosyltransferase YjiC (YdhE family)